MVWHNGPVEHHVCAAAPRWTGWPGVCIVMPAAGVCVCKPHPATPQPLGAQTLGDNKHPPPSQQADHATFCHLSHLPDLQDPVFPHLLPQVLRAGGGGC